MSTVYCYGSMRGHSRRVEARQEGILEHRDGFFGGGDAGFFRRIHRILHRGAFSKMSPVHTFVFHTYIGYGRARRWFVATHIGNLPIGCQGGAGDGTQEPIVGCPLSGELRLPPESGSATRQCEMHATLRCRRHSSKARMASPRRTSGGFSLRRWCLGGAWRWCRCERRS
jgi:hypothetical protein